MKELNNIGDLFETFTKDMGYLISKSKVNALFCKKYELEVSGKDSREVVNDIANKLIEYNLLQDLEFAIEDGQPDLVGAWFDNEELDEDVLYNLCLRSSWVHDKYVEQY